MGAGIARPTVNKSAVKLEPGVCQKMSGSIVVFLILAAAIVLLGVIGTVVVVLREGRGRNPREVPERPWTAGNLPSVPYSKWRL